MLLLCSCGDSPAELSSKAEAAYASHDYRTARIQLAAALAAQPGNRGLQLLQARTLIALGDGEGGGAALQNLTGVALPQGELAELSAEAALLRKAPKVALATLGSLESVEAERLRALATLQLGDFAKAGEHFAKGVALGGNGRLYSDSARYKLLAGDGHGAHEMLAQAEKTAPEGLDTLLVGGQMALGEGNLAHALDRYGRASKLYPSSLAALTGKAATLGDLGRAKEMKALVDQALAFDPKDMGLVFLKARSAESEKDWAGLRAIVQPIESELPQVHPIRLLYSEALLRLGQNDQAQAQLAPLIVRQPGNHMALRLMAEAQLASGDVRQASTTLRPIADLPTATGEELALMARIAEKTGDPLAKRYQERARFPAPQSIIRDLAEGDTAIRSRDWARAIVAYEHVLSVTDGRNALLLNNMAFCQLMVGNGDMAASFAARALNEAPDNPSVLDTAGWIAFKSGKDRQNALRLLRLAAEKAPNNATIQAHLAEAAGAPG